MIEEIRDILKKYWGYERFRPLQEEIILSILTNNDTLALLPTGGGKSICFQVPAIYNNGLCLVITPLIALMKDQVENLNKRDISAAAIFSGMSYKEIDVTLDNAVFGKYKFLYVAPERLQTDIFLARANNMKICMVAVDEAHCISEWGYDFRPSYLQIAKLREIFSNIPFLALTATATEAVKKDILDKLKMKDPQVFQQSFERQNLIYGVLHDEAKANRLLELVNKVKGSGIVYCRTRKQTKDIADFLVSHKISADFYHAGLKQQERSEKQDNWINGKTRLIVATNAFGMGIDKPDVRIVVHMSLPDSLEAYYQEAGRGGRDLKKSYALAIVNNSDKTDFMDRVPQLYPKIDEIRNVYHALGNYFQIPVGSGKDSEFEFSINDFCTRYNLDLIKSFNSLKFLEKEELIKLSDVDFMPSRLLILESYNDLYNFQLANPKYELLIKTLLRSYDGLFDVFCRIDEKEIAKRADMSEDEVIKELQYLSKISVCDYIPPKNKPQIIYLQARLDKSQIDISPEILINRKKKYELKLESVLNYAFSSNGCRSKILLNYFGEKLVKDCGHCDYCLKSNSIGISQAEFESIYSQLLSLIKESPVRLAVLPEIIKANSKDKISFVVKWLTEQNIIKINNEQFIFPIE